MEAPISIKDFPEENEPAANQKLHIIQCSYTTKVKNPFIKHIKNMHDWSINIDKEKLQGKIITDS